MANVIPLVAVEPAPSRVAWPDRLPEGRIVEICGRGAGTMTTAASCVIRAQREGSPVAWVQREDGPLYPPDLHDAGVDLDALVVVHAPSAAAVARATELLLRSGAFGCVVTDFGAGTPTGVAWQTRLAGLCRQHHARLLLLSGGSERDPSLGPMVALRLEPRLEPRGDRVELSHRVLKAKVPIPPVAASLSCRPPAGAERVAEPRAEPHRTASAGG